MTQPEPEGLSTNYWMERCFPNRDGWGKRGWDVMINHYDPTYESDGIDYTITTFFECQVCAAMVVSEREHAVWHQRNHG